MKYADMQICSLQLQLHYRARDYFNYIPSALLMQFSIHRYTIILLYCYPTVLSPFLPPHTKIFVNWRQKYSWKIFEKFEKNEICEKHSVVTMATHTKAHIRSSSQIAISKNHPLLEWLLLRSIPWDQCQWPLTIAIASYRHAKVGRAIV